MIYLVNNKKIQGSFTLKGDTYDDDVIRIKTIETYIPFDIAEIIFDLTKQYVEEELWDDFDNFCVKKDYDDLNFYNYCLFRKDEYPELEKYLEKEFENIVGFFEIHSVDDPQEEFISFDGAFSKEEIKDYYFENVCAEVVAYSDNFGEVLELDKYEI